MVIDTSPDDERQYRRECGELLGDTLKLQQVTRKELRQRLATLGISVSEQAVGYWVRGETLPNVIHQHAIAKALGATHRSLFPAPRAVA